VTDKDGTDNAPRPGDISRREFIELAAMNDLDEIEWVEVSLG
jgi:hypothetical protein